MPPRFAYWTILAGGLPTSFRAAEQDELMPTFRRLKERHPDAEMKYFARGKLWESADEARQALVRERQAQRPRSDRHREGERRGREWRPGGEHRDPRQPFKDAKQARNRDRRQQRWERKTDQRRSPAPQGTAATRHPKKPRPAQGQRADTARGRPPRLKPHGDKFRDEVPRRPFKPSGHRRFERTQEAPRPAPQPDRRPPPDREPKPEPPPRPSEPAIRPPGPPERGRESNRGTRPRQRRRKE